MGYGLGVFLLALGLILALAVPDLVDAVDVPVTLGWIMVLVGLLVVVGTAVQANRRRHGAPAHRLGQDPRPPAY